MAKVEIFEWENKGKGWNELCPMKTARFGHAVYPIPGDGVDGDCDKLFVCGGTGKKQKGLRSAEIYNSATDEWVSVAKMKVARFDCFVSIVTRCFTTEM